MSLILFLAIAQAILRPLASICAVRISDNEFFLVRSYNLTSMRNPLVANGYKFDVRHTHMHASKHSPTHVAHTHTMERKHIDRDTYTSYATLFVRTHQRHTYFRYLRIFSFFSPFALRRELSLCTRTMCSRKRTDMRPIHSRNTTTANAKQTTNRKKKRIKRKPLTSATWSM